jgi:hypothetical protein
MSEHSVYEATVQHLTGLELKREAQQMQIAGLERERDAHLMQIAGLVAERDALRADIPALLAEVAKLRGALGAVEWETDENGNEAVEFDFCPWCRSRRHMGHAENCQRQVALGLAQEEDQT